MSIHSVAALVGTVGHLRLLEPAQANELARAVAPRFGEPLALAKELVKRGWLTPYQVNHLFQGEAGQLTLGPYLLLEKISEGVMGDVFRARHTIMRRLVALQVIRPELLRHPEAVERFYQEVRLSSQLSHPNVVASFDAGPVGATHFFAMEYIDGIDLERRVRQEGPLPIVEACEFIRQAALGLEHAAQRGLRHYDLTPANLLWTPARCKEEGSGSSLGSLVWGQVKIRNLGLTVIRQPTRHTRLDADRSHERTGLHSPDYVAPERIATSGLGDTRAELYSLGCTFYFLLAGEVPFPGGTVEEKHRRHLTQAPESLEVLRPGIAPEVQAIVANLMAKRPEDRYATPFDVSVAVGRVPATVFTGAVAKGAGNAWQKRGAAARRRQWRFVGIGAAVLLVAGGLFAWLLARQTNEAAPVAVTTKAMPVVLPPILASKPALQLHLGRVDGFSWFDALSPGYGIKYGRGMPGGPWAHENYKVWCLHDGVEVNFTVQVPPRTGGELRLFCRDGDTQGRKQRLIVDGKPIKLLESFGPAGVWVSVRLAAHEIKNGSINVSVVNVPPSPNCVISRVEFYPLVSPDELPPPPGPAFVYQCGRGHKVERTPPYADEIAMSGFNILRVSGEPYDGWPASAGKTHCWAGSPLKFSVHVPPGISGKLKLLFVDLEGERKMKVNVQGKYRETIGGIKPPGRWCEVPIGSADTRGSLIDVEVVNLAGDKWNSAVSTVEFWPAAK